MSKPQGLFFLSGRTKGKQVIKRFACVYIYIVGNLAQKYLNQTRLIIQYGCVKSEQSPFFFIHWLYVEGSCTRWTVPFFLSAHVNGREWKICTWGKKVALKLHESFWGALPYLASSKSSPLFPLEGVMWKQTTTDCAITCSSRLFLPSSEHLHFPVFNRSMAFPKSLTATELAAYLTMSALTASSSVKQLTCSHLS